MTSKRDDIFLVVSQEILVKKRRESGKNNNFYNAQSLLDTIRMYGSEESALILPNPIYSGSYIPIYINILPHRELFPYFSDFYSYNFMPFLSVS